MACMSLSYGPERLPVTPASAEFVRILDSAGQPAALTSPVVVDANGRVSFTVLIPGRYFVKVVNGPAVATDTVDLTNVPDYDFTDPRSYTDAEIDRVTSGAVDPDEIEDAIVAYLETHSEDLLTPHINDETPHPAYDDLPSLRLLFENGLI